MSNEGIVGEIFGWIGSVLAIIFYISPVVPFYDLIKEKITYKETPGVLLIMSFFNCILWGVYGLRGDKIQVWLTNFLGAFITIIFIITYLIYLSEQKIFQSILYNLITFNFVIEIFYVSYKLVDNEYVGNTAMIFNILMYAAPGEKIYQVFQTGKYDLLPIVSSVCGLCSATSWFIYGIYKSDSNIYVPNGLGILFALLQIGVWYNFYRKRDETEKIKLNSTNEYKDTSVNQN